MRLSAPAASVTAAVLPALFTAIVSASLFIVVFGLSLGGRIKEIDGVPYKQFIVPGLIVMAMVQASYANNSASVFQARIDLPHSMCVSNLQANRYRPQQGSCSGVTG